MGVYRMSVRLDMENEMHRQLYEWIKKRDKNRYHSVADYFIVAAACLENMEKNILSEKEKKELCELLVAELQKQGFLSHRVGL